MRELERLSDLWRTQTAQGVRIVAFGSSNTDLRWHADGRLNWVCWLECALRHGVGHHVSVTNAGISGENSAELLARFDRDVVPHAPAAVIVTIGGNDQRTLTLEQYRENLVRLIERIRALKSEPIFQTYYAFMDHEIAEAGPRFHEFMQAKREVARAQSVPCIDQHAWFVPWYRAQPREYAGIMRDAMHLNPLGNLLMGILCIRSFGLSDPEVPADLKASSAQALARMARHVQLPPAR
jgi:lysophospholipase L1-like esterase